MVGLALVLWAGRLLFAHGFEPPAVRNGGNRARADAIRQLVVPAFYAANFVSIALNFETGPIRPNSLFETLQAIGAKLGATVIVVAATCLLATAIIRAFNGSTNGRAQPPGTNVKPG